MYKFFVKNGLFKKKWDFDQVMNQICDKPNVPCRRRVPLKYFDRNFTMGGIDMGRVEIWGHQEVVDVLYSLRKHYNLTEADQIEKFSEICHTDEVYCERTRAVVFRKTEITKLDFEKFGNETCKRQFVGVKFRSSFVNLPFGGQLSDFLKKDSSRAVSRGDAVICLLRSTELIMTSRSVDCGASTLLYTTAASLAGSPSCNHGHSKGQKKNQSLPTSSHCFLPFRSCICTAGSLG